jgi:plasmid stabilization system protein ParE
MTWTLRIRPQARLEMIQATQWYAEQGGSVGIRFQQALDDTLARIQENALQYQIVHGNLRRAPVHGFPYFIIYSIKSAQLIVAACVHGRRDPLRWMRRR